jgi:hypothetical protein
VFGLGLGEFLILWSLLGCLVAWFWKSKGLSFGWGFFWSFILSPVLAFIIGLLRRPNLKAKDDYQLADGQMKTCPFCAEVIRQQARVCRYCGRDLDGATAAG